MSNPIHISKPKDLKIIRSSIKFCYLCGEDLAGSDVNKDHIPPIKCFAPSDRLNPLILNTHKKCNSGWSIADNRLGEILSSFNGRQFSEDKPAQIKAVKMIDRTTGEEFGAITGVDLKQVVRRIVKGFHAALYRQLLPVNTVNSISLQFPSSSVKGLSDWEGLHPMHGAVVHRLYVDRVMNRCDSVSIYNDKCRYICSWDRLDNGVSCCLFAISLYEWEQMVDPRLGPKACCVGLYSPPGGRPKGAAISSPFVLPPYDGVRLNPFDD